MVKESYFENGKGVAEFSSFRLTDQFDPRVFNCVQPQPADNIDKQLENHLDYLTCGLWMDVFDVIAPQIKVIELYIESLKNSNDYRNDGEELNRFQAMYNKTREILGAINDKISGYKIETTALTGLLKALEDRINQLKEKTQTEVVLVPLELATDAEYDEVTDNEIKLTFTLTEKSTGLPYIKSPIAIDFALVKSNTSDAYVIKTVYSNIVNGLVVFKFDPATVPELRTMSSVSAMFAFSKDDWSPQFVRNITLKWVNPIAVLKGGSSIPIPLKYVNGEIKNFKIVNGDGRDLLVDYNNVTINNLSNSKVGYSMLKGTDDFSIKL